MCFKGHPIPAEVSDFPDHSPDHVLANVKPELCEFPYVSQLWPAVIEFDFNLPVKIVLTVPPSQFRAWIHP